MLDKAERTPLKYYQIRLIVEMNFFGDFAMILTAGIDLKRGRPTPSVGSTQAKLQQRKLDALRRGVHRVNDAETLAYGVHVIGVGGAGVKIVHQMLLDAPSSLLETSGSRMSVLAIDVGDSEAQAMVDIQSLSKKFNASQSHIETLTLEVPSNIEMNEVMQAYRMHLELEYPLLQGTAEFQPWIAGDMPFPAKGKSLPRSLAKAIYGKSYYDGSRPMAKALKRFANSTNATNGDAIVCIVFGLGGGTGSGIAVDLARHLSCGIFGRRVLVMGIGIAPCDGDQAVHQGAQLFATINELDALCNEHQNQGVVQACGELYKNPFTAGFLQVPQQPTYSYLKDLQKTHLNVSCEVAALLLERRGANLWEALRLLNWVAAPSTQHSAARTPWGSGWMHIFGFADSNRIPEEALSEFFQHVGILPPHRAEFIEIRAREGGPQAEAWAESMDLVFCPEVPATTASGGREGSIQFVIPRVSKVETRFFYSARDAYDRLPLPERVLVHSLLLERGVVLCEPSSRLEGMAGASLSEGGAWVLIPFESMRGPNAPPIKELSKKLQEMSHAT